MTSYGRNISVSLFGGSHDSEIGIKVRGLPSGIKVDTASLSRFLKRRAPGQNDLSTPRKEDDVPVFLSGVTDGYTDGGEFCAVIRNTNTRSSDYDSTVPRPSHADYPAYVKSGGQADLAGGGHFSGRLTAPLCVIGGILKDELYRRGIKIGAHICSVGTVTDRRFDPVKVSEEDFDAVLSRSLPVLDGETAEKMRELILRTKEAKDSVGGVIECAVIGLPVGVGEHFFDGMESRISSIVFSVPAVKGIEFGAGFASAAMTGSENNDAYETDGITVTTKTNNCGGILGGMTDGMPLLFRCAIKPTPSIGIKQDSVDLTTRENVTLEIKGRHDPCIVPRAVPVIEAATAIAVFDALLDTGDMEK